VIEKAEPITKEEKINLKEIGWKNNYIVTFKQIPENIEITKKFDTLEQAIEFANTIEEENLIGVEVELGWKLEA